MKTYTKDGLIEELRRISSMGWIANARSGNHGGIGNTLEDLLGIEENNLPIPNAAEWELKSQRLNTKSLITLFHTEPSPRAIKFIPQMLLPKYGWPHKEAGIKYPKEEKSFRQTIHGLSASDRGFKVVIDRSSKKVLISFNKDVISDKHNNWMNEVSEKAGLYELAPQPYWGFDDLEHIVGTKLLNCFFVQAKVKKISGIEHYHYTTAMMLRGFDFDKFLVGMETGYVLVDFDARSGHNHGSKFRMRSNYWPQLYSDIEILF